MVDIIFFWICFVKFCCKFIFRICWLFFYMDICFFGLLLVGDIDWGEGVVGVFEFVFEVVVMVVWVCFWWVRNECLFFLECCFCCIRVIFFFIFCCFIFFKFILWFWGLVLIDNDFWFVVVLGLGGVYVFLMLLRLGDFLSFFLYNWFFLMLIVFNIFCLFLFIIWKVLFLLFLNCWIIFICIVLCVFENLFRVFFECCFVKFF